MPRPVMRKKADRRSNDGPASLLGGFLSKDRRSGVDRRKRKAAPSRKGT